MGGRAETVRPRRGSFGATAASAKFGASSLKRLLGGGGRRCGAAAMSMALAIIACLEVGSSVGAAAAFLRSPPPLHRSGLGGGMMKVSRKGVGGVAEGLLSLSATSSPSPDDFMSRVAAQFETLLPEQMAKRGGMPPVGLPDETASAVSTAAASPASTSTGSSSSSAIEDFFDATVTKFQNLNVESMLPSRSYYPSSSSDPPMPPLGAEESWSTVFTRDIVPIDRALDSLQRTWISYLHLPPLTQVALIVVPTATFLLLWGYQLSHPPDDFRRGYEPYTRGNYDPIAARAYYSRYPLLVARRSLQLLRYSYKFIAGVLFDKYVVRNEEVNRAERAAELLDLINRAGPTAIKVGQALSVRPDLIPSEYADALSTLQDRVPPFDSGDAKIMLREELGPEGMEKVIKGTKLDEAPVASASIGQVYRGTATLSDGTQREVAIKVQRPDILSEIALDLHIVREFAPYYQRMTRSATDFQSLANEWGRGFIAELDYANEAANTMQFNADMQRRGLDAVIIAPTVVDELSTERILTTEWVNGSRLDESTAGDVPRLCSVALNAYLVMLLDTGTLHCDPHPGNLLRTDDGKLALLDFGMTLETDPNLQYSLLEFVAHLTSQEYDEVPTDLVKLGFLKADRLDTVRASGFLEPLTYMLRQAGEGGGADKVRERIFAEYREKFPGVEDEDLRVLMRDDMKAKIEEARIRESAVSGITLEVEELQKRNRDAFSIPEWFLYTSRAFLTLEGICLQADPDYSIVQSCFPYVARRLLSDDSPRAQAALKDLLYGTGNLIDTERLTDLADGFTTYSRTTKSLKGSDALVEGDMPDQKPTKRTFAETEAAVGIAKDSADILLATEGNLVQDIIVDEGTAALSAQVKDALREALLDRPNRIREGLPLNIGRLLPSPPVNDLVPFLKKSEEEERAQALLGRVASFARSLPSQSLPSSSDQDEIYVLSGSAGFDDVDPEQIALVAKELRENLPKYAPMAGQFGGKFSSSLLRRLSRDLERGLSEESSSGTTNPIVRAAARGLSRAAKQSAEAIRDTE